MSTEIEKRDLVLSLWSSEVDETLSTHCLSCKHASNFLKKSSREEGYGTEKKVVKILLKETHCGYFNCLMNDHIYHCERHEPLSLAEE